MRYIVQVFLVLLVIKPIAAYAQTPEAQSPPSVSAPFSPSTSRAPKGTEDAPAKSANAGASVAGTSRSQQSADPTPVRPADGDASPPLTQQAKDRSQPSPAAPPAKQTKVKKTRHHLSGFDIALIVGCGILLLALHSL
jgi:hypothetical protein